MQLVKLCHLCLLLSLSFSEALGQDRAFPYDLEHPIQTIVLPAELQEVSGISLLDTTLIACVQDEKGIVYFVNSYSGKIVRQVSFYGEGDYEDIAVVGKQMFVLRSDGALFEITAQSSKSALSTIYNNFLPAKESEGLVYDSQEERLLIACKSKHLHKPEAKYERYIFAFDLKERKLAEHPALILDVREVQKFAISRGLKFGMRKVGDNTTKRAEHSLRFAMSAIGIHPFTKDFYILSASDHFLLVCTQSGRLVEIVYLNPSICNKAEGISFLPNGDLLLSNEGQSGAGTILRFALEK